jgi:hypothetical protein
VIETPEDLTEARMALGLGYVELARALGLTGSDENVRKRILDMEMGVRPISGPIRVAVTAMVNGFDPYD